MKNTAKKIFFYFAIIGWGLSLSVNIFSILNYNVEEKYPYVFLLHIGIFIVWLPAMIIMMKNNKSKKEGLFDFSFINPFTFFKSMFGYAPIWLRTVAITGFFYAFVNFFISFGFPSFIPGQNVLHDEEYSEQRIENVDHNEANTTRGFSGHWLAFYGIAAAVLYPYRRKENNAEDGYIKDYK